MLIELGGRSIEYRFLRRHRRTIGLTVDASGLRVAAPLRAPWREIEGFLRSKARWICTKLDAWACAPRAVLLRAQSGESLPLLGTAHVLEVREGRRRVEHAPGRLLVVAPRRRARDALLRWLKEQALEALAPRAAHYALRLGRPAPRVALSNARWQWGVCHADGSIRLAWRLVHLEPALSDYVVAHEVAHLVELNHSRRFWRVLAALYPDWRQARERLELAAAVLPILTKGET